MKIPRKYEGMLFALILSGLMSFLVSGIATLGTVGLIAGFMMSWVGAWLSAWPVAFPAVMVVAPMTRKLVRRLVAED